MSAFGGIRWVKGIGLVGLTTLLCMLALPSATAFTKEIHVYSTSFGEAGTGNGQFTEPAGVAVSEVGAAKGDVYVVDKGDDRVEMFNAAGTYLSQFDDSAAPTGAFSTPRWIAVDNSSGPSAGDVYITEVGSKVIDKVSPTGVYLCQILGPEKRCLKEEGEETVAEKAALNFEEPLGVAVDPAGMLWIYYASDGFGSITNYSNALTNAYISNRKSQAGEGYASPGLGFAVNSEDDLYAGFQYEQISELNESGELIHQVLDGGRSTAVAVDPATVDAYVDNVTTINVLNSADTLIDTFGDEEGAAHLAEGSGIAVNSNSPAKLVYVADISADAVRVFTRVVVPDVTTEAASEVGASSVTLHGTVDPDGTSVSRCEFEYGTEEGVYTQTAPCSPATPLTGNAPMAVSAELTGLSTTTRYYFRLSATNSNGTNDGSGLTFATIAPPAILSEEVLNILTAEPKLAAAIDPDYGETSYHFEYSTKASGETLEPPITVVEGSPPTALPAVLEERSVATAPLHGLIAGPAYYYRVVATNAAGTVEGELQFFRARATPSVSGGAAGATTRATATVSAPVIPDGLPTTFHVAYMTQSGYEAALAEGATNPYAMGHSTSESQTIGSAYATATATGLLQELSPATTYHYAIVATNSLGSTIGPDGTFTTSAATGPEATTGGAEAVSQLAATITGSVNTQGLQTTVQFEFGTTPYAGTLQSATVTSGSGTSESFSSDESNLLPATTYYYRAVASSQDGSSYGAEQSFTTASFPTVLSVTPPPPFVSYATIAELNRQEAKEAPKPPKPLTRAQKLAKALRACTKKPKKQRAGCRRQAKRLYGPLQLKKKPKRK